MEGFFFQVEPWQRPLHILRASGLICFSRVGAHLLPPSPFPGQLVRLGAQERVYFGYSDDLILFFFTFFCSGGGAAVVGVSFKSHQDLKGLG